MNKWKLQEFRSNGFLNKKPDMGRVYIDLPLIKAMELLKGMNNEKTIYVLGESSVEIYDPDGVFNRD